MVKKNILGGDMIKNHRGANAEYGQDTREKKQNFASLYTFCPGSNGAKKIKSILRQCPGDKICWFSFFPQF